MLCLIGEAPGAEEEKQGRPFVGPSGKLLDQLLTAAGLVRSEVWITNVVPFRPVIRHEKGVRNRAPTRMEAKAWSAYLEGELERIQPRVLLGLGAVAGKALVSSDFKIARQRGCWYRDRAGREILVTWHPAYLLRQQGSERDLLYSQAIDDFRAVALRLRELGPPRKS